MKPVLIFVVNDSWFFVSHRLPIAHAAIAAGYTVHVLAKEDHKTIEITNAGCEFHAWDLAPRGKSIVAELKSFMQVRRLIRKISPDIVHLVTIKSVLYGGIAARFSGVKNVVVAVAGMGSMFDRQQRIIGKLQPLIRGVYRFATTHPKTTFIFQNSNDQAEFTRIFNLQEHAIRLLHGSGVDLEALSADQAPLSPPVVIMGARLIRDKGVFEFIEAARQVKAVLPEVRFQLAGGPLAEGHPSAVTPADLEGANHDSVVEILGHVDDMVALLNQATLATLPSYYNEGLPKFLAEAAAAGCPVVTTDHPGCRDAVEANVTGFLVPVKDANALAEELIKLLTDDALLESMSNAARKRAEQLFDVNVIAQAHLTIYEQ